MKELRALAGYTFDNPELLRTALRHRSAGKPHNERLEFLGDSLLGAVVAEWLYQNHPDLDEGDLTRMRSRLVCGDSLTHLARDLQLGQYIQLGPGELKSGGHRRDSILADAFEAVIAAIYLDSDFNTMRKWLLARIEPVAEQRLRERPLKDAKTRLQEWLQQYGRPLPEYELVAEEGPEHRRIFHVLCRVEGAEEQASGSSRKRAEQQAAEQMLAKLGNPGDE